MGLAYLAVIFGIPLALFEDFFYNAFAIVALPFVVAEAAFYKIAEIFNK